MARTLNRVQLIGRLGADPEMRFTSAGMPVTTFSLATNRAWTGKDGTPQEETDWHTIVAWDKLAQLCNEFLTRGRLVYIEGRLHTRSWDSNGQKAYKTEIVASDMLLLDSKGNADPQATGESIRLDSPAPPTEARQATAAVTRERTTLPVKTASTRAGGLDDPEDLPF